MNLWLQIGLGLLPLCAVVIFLLFWRRIFRRGAILLTALLVLGTGGLLTGGLLEKDNASAAVMSGKDMLRLGYALAQQEQWDAARSMLTEYSRAYGYNEECSLFSARLSAMEGDSRAALGVYQKLSAAADARLQGELKKEMLAVSAVSDSAASDMILVQYLKKQGADPAAYGLAPDSNLTAMEAMAAAASRAASDQYEDREIQGVTFKDIAKLVAQAQALYDAYLQGAKPEDGEDSLESAAKKIRNRFNTAAEAFPDAFTVRPVRLARLKMQVLTGDFKDIAGQLDDFASHDELLIASELYINDYVSQSSFPENWSIYDQQQLNKVYSRLDQLVESQYAEAPKPTRRQAKERVSALKKVSGDVVLSNLKSRLTGALEENEAQPDATKIYLQLSKIDNHIGNEVSANRNLALALDTAGDCRDDAYTQPMYEISGIIRGDDGSENIKNVAGYVEQVVDNSLTVQLAPELMKPSKEETSGSTGGILGGSNNDDDKGNGDKEEKDDAKEFGKYMEDYVSKARAAVNIGALDLSRFPQISARVQIASDYITALDELKAALTVSDCYAPIPDFQLEKIEFSGANVLLLCDVSGSMSGSIGKLRDAVSAFIADRNEEERIAIVGFDSDIVFEYGLDSTDAQLQEAIGKLQARGGTNMYDALVSCIEDFPNDPRANNVIILMTDGQDNNPRNEADIQRYIGEAAQNKSISVYTMGLGSSVDTAYLSTIAAAGSGSFLYVSGDDSLSTFYDFIHGQIANQYLLTYTAKDTLTTFNRVLQVGLPSEKLQDTRIYSLADNPDAPEDSLLFARNLSVTGFDTRVLYKGSASTEIRLKGSGFQKEDAVSVKLNGNLDYGLTAVFEDANTYKLTVPAGVAVGVYDAEITINGRTAVLSRELTVVVKGQERVVKFGPYTFTASAVVEESDNVLRLSGAVTLNEWMRFRGDIVLTGDVASGGSIRMQDDSGSYVAYNVGTAGGLAKYMAQKGASFNIPALGSVTLYNDQSHINDLENYHVERMRVPVLSLFETCVLFNASVSLYPDRIQLDISAATTALPFQDTLMKTVGAESPFDLELSASGVVTGTDIGILVDYKGSQSNEELHTMKLFSAPIYWDLNKTKFHLDTIKQEVSFELRIKVAFIKADTIGLAMGWKGGNLDEIKLFADFDVNTNWGGVPITFSDFGLGLKDMSTVTKERDKEKLLDMKLEGSFTISAAKLSAYFPSFKKYVGDISVLSMPDTTFQIGLRKFFLSAKADLMFLDEIKLAEAEIKIGSFPYSNEMLRLDGVNVDGLMASLKLGLMWDIKDCHVDISGKGEFDAHSRFVGAELDGTCDLDLQWWLFKKSYHYDCAVLLGLYTTHSGNMQFTIRTREVDSRGKVSGVMLYIDSSGLGMDKNYLS